MGMLSCYTVFGRRSKTPILSSPKAGLKAGGKGNMESRGVAVEGMDADACILADAAMLKGNVMQQDGGAEYVIDCNALVDSSPNEPLVSEKGFNSTENTDVHETVIDIHKLEEPGPEAESLHHDLLKSCYESRVWSSCSQGTFQGDVSLSVGEGTISSNGRAALPHQQGGTSRSLGTHEYAASEDSLDDVSNRSSHRNRSHDGHSVRSARNAKQFEYSDDDGGQVISDQPYQRSDAVKGNDRLENAQLFCQVDPPVHNDDAYSRHASDPGVYEREVVKMSPSMQGDGLDSPLMDANESKFLRFANVREGGEGEAGDEEKASLIPPISSEPHPSNQGVLHDDADPSFDRVKEWINSLQQSDVDFGDTEENAVMSGIGLSLEPPYNAASVASQSVEHANVDHALGHAAVRALHPSSTVAHVSGIGLREVPSLGMFISLKTLNLSANLITHVPVGCLPKSLHALDLSRNRIAQIEGLRELTRLRVLNLSYNRISRIGHGLANCTLIKELYLAGNKIAEVEGLHRLLKLAVLDLSFNKLTTSKALGQLAANYGSLAALNLLGNPILTNFSEDQMRKLVSALTPHVMYLNKQPIKVVSVREAALDSVARAALGTAQRHGKSRDAKAGRGSQLSAVKKKPPTHQHGSRHLDKKLVSATSSGHHRHHHHHHGKGSVKGQGTDPMPSAKALAGFQNIALESRLRAMPRSRSADVLAGATLIPDV